MDTVFLHNLKVDAEIGVYDFERGKRQRLLFDIELEFDCQPAGQSDDLTDAIDYAAVAETVRQIAEGSSYQLVEALAERVAAELLEQFAVTAVHLCLGKPGAVADADSVGVAIERRRER